MSMLSASAFSKTSPDINVCSSKYSKRGNTEHGAEKGLLLDKTASEEILMRDVCGVFGQESLSQQMYHSQT